MFTPIEVKFLQIELKNFISRSQKRLEDTQIKEDKREIMETKLIAAVSIANKLDHLTPVQENIHKEARVLIVDDVESMRKVHRHYFMECGFNWL
ncbi:response regulator [Flocculibacter collagenilyticus]|uniref:hypothetical protein n=1 Tax=Flocculibacter collagenilyticus TaxID=2744479 RepID=UPI0018F394AC|nr:hypothetical protein [Flocculibacter collagenilyticus]